MDLNAALQSVVTAMAAVSGVETASTDPAAIVAPGALVQLAQLERLTMTGWLVTTQVTLVVADSDGGPGPAAQLGSILSAMLTAGIQPDGPIVARSVQLPSAPAPLPGLLVPIEVRIDA